MKKKKKRRKKKKKKKKNFSKSNFQNKQNKHGQWRRKKNGGKKKKKNPKMSCPVDHKNMKTTAEFIDLSKQEQQHQQQQQTTQIPNEQSQQKSSSTTTESQNQAQPEKSKVNPLNQMEDIENESLPNQKGKLGKERVSSSIPKGEHTPHHQSDKTDNWVYPSEQMFYNAMKVLIFFFFFFF